MTFHATEVYKRQCIRTEWHIIIPTANNSVVSPPFTLETCKWVFRVVSVCPGYVQDGAYSIKFVKYCTNKMPENFLFTVHLKIMDGHNLYLQTCKEINSPEVEVCKIDRRSLNSHRSQFSTTQNKLKLVSTFYFDSYKQENKSVQTFRQDLHSLYNLSLDLGKLMDEGDDPDVLLKCGDCIIPAHKFILGARSEVFRAMLQSDMLERRKGSVDIIDMEPKVFEVFIRYLYTGHLPQLSDDVALPLYEVGDKYHVIALKARCSDFLAENLTRKIACEVLFAADAHSDKDLKDRVISYILDEKIPKYDDVWLKFCDSHPKLAIEVYRRSYNPSVLNGI